MADLDVVKISSLPLATSISDSDTLLAIQNEHAKRVPPSLMKGEKGNPGNTPILKKGNVSTGSTADVSIQKNDTDSNGNPIYILNIVLPKGDKGNTGKTPVLGTVITTTGEAGSNATAKFTLNGTDADGNPKYDLVLTIPQGAKGNIGFTPILQIGMVTGGDTADAGIVQNGTDTNGNPIYKVNLTLPKGSTGNVGKTPQIAIGKVTTLAAGSDASASVVSDGVDTSGNPKYKLNLSLPQGANGSLGSGDAKDLTVSFTEAAERNTIESGSTMATVLGRIKKWFTDLKSVAFSGSYTDLSNKPTIPTKTSQLTNDSSLATITNITDAVVTHNSNASAHSDIRTSLASIQAIAEGKSRARVFATVAALDTWLSNAANTALLQVGDNFYITATDVPDYWWDGSAKQKLETEKVSLVEYLKSSDAATTYVAKVSGLTANTNGLYKMTTNSDGLVTAVTPVTKTDITSLGIPAQDTTYSNATKTVSGLMSAEDKSKFDFYTGSNSVTTLASLPVTKNLVIATLSAATTISLAAALAVNQSIHVCAIAAATFTQAIPNANSFTSMSGSSVSITSGAHFEIDILCTAASTYQIMVSIQN